LDHVASLEIPFEGKSVLDVGCGLAPDTVHYAEHGARVTFLDVVESNVAFAERACRIKGIQNAAFCYMRDLDSLRALPADYDGIYCCGTCLSVDGGSNWVTRRRVGSARAG
jgi:2-polyprenyl-3-methyl-5-hydroxy-6-metoxy-1,4-benzoquinol methylase